MASSAAIPGVQFVASRAPAALSALRTDIAAFAGRTRCGPVGSLVRLEGWKQFESVFGGVWRHSTTPYSVRGYFENGGEVAYVVRVGNPATATSASAVWSPGRNAADPLAALAGFQAGSFRLVASSPGTWANGMLVAITYRRVGANGPALDIVIKPRERPVETLYEISPANFVQELADRSAYLRATPTGPPPQVPFNPPAGPGLRAWAGEPRQRAEYLPAPILEGGTEPVADTTRYVEAVQKVSEEPEAALLSMPDLPADSADAAAHRQVVVSAAQLFAETIDRMVVLDLPRSIDQPEQASAWLAALGQDSALDRTLAAYHPWLRIVDPLGDVIEPQRVVPPSGHVAGVMSRIDRERGAYVTPANVSLEGVIDVDVEIDARASGGLNDLGINALRCRTGRGVMVWGARMLLTSDEGLRFVAHRRLMHRLVRAIRRVARPLVFETNGPVLWLALSRAATTLLLEAFRAGALKGNRPEEAFRVRCDEALNPPQVRDVGRVHCEVSFAPAVPMEFITLRVALGADGSLEVAEP